MLGRGLPQATPWPLGFQKHPTRLLIFKRSFAVTHNCPQILSVQRLWWKRLSRLQSSLCLVDPCHVFSHLSASIDLTFSLLPRVLTSKQRLESDLSHNMILFFASLSLFQERGYGIACPVCGATTFWEEFVPRCVL